MSRRQWDTLITIVVIAIIFFTLGWVGNNDLEMQKLQRISDMKYTCANAHDTIDGSREMACGELIDFIEQDGKSKVVEHDGDFTVVTR